MTGQRMATGRPEDGGVAEDPVTGELAALWRDGAATGYGRRQSMAAWHR